MLKFEAFLHYHSLFLHIFKGNTNAFNLSFSSNRDNKNGMFHWIPNNMPKYLIGNLLFIYHDDCIEF